MQRMKHSVLFVHYAYIALVFTQAAVIFAFSNTFTALSSGNFVALKAPKLPTFHATSSLSIEATTTESKLLLVDALLSDKQSINQNILASISLDVQKDVRWAKESSLPFEADRGSNHATETEQLTIEYEPISQSSSIETIALRTKPSTPLLTQSEITLLREAVETYWGHENNDTSSKSRFTYQRKGNSEAHLSDVVQYFEQNYNGEEKQQQVSDLVDKLLLDRIYPWVRNAFLSKEDESHDDDLSLYVYDSIFIRYNATEAENIGAGQPLHRDLGYVSVNIMLNSGEDFVGGGTFFENQLAPVVMNGVVGTSGDIQPLKPVGPGHAIAHYSSSRHAGAATFDGVRDILVLFVAAASAERPPKWEIAARLKTTARAYCGDAHDVSNIGEQLLCRVRHHRLAIEHVPDDGEAWHYLGMALLDYHNYKVALKQQQDCANNDSVLRLAVSCLEEATTYTPCDGRLLNNLGLAWECLLEYHQSDDEEKEMSVEDLNSLLGTIRDEVTKAFERSIQIHKLCKQVGCDVNTDYESACLNYGLYLSKLDDFEGAIEILSLVASNYAACEDTDSGAHDASFTSRRRVLRDASNLLGFCKKQLK